MIAAGIIIAVVGLAWQFMRGDRIGGNGPEVLVIVGLGLILGGLVS